MDVSNRLFQQMKLSQQTEIQNPWMLMRLGKQMGNAENYEDLRIKLRLFRLYPLVLLALLLVSILSAK